MLLCYNFNIIVNNLNIFKIYEKLKFQERNNLNYLYASNRSSYFKNGSLKKEDAMECPFCQKMFADKHKDRDNLILKRGKNTVIMLNLYPYNAGHLLILPYDHTSELSYLTYETRIEIMEEINNTIKILEDFFKCSGINVGINKGKVSGGSVASHLHIHVIPRYENDTNFLMTCDQTKVISISPFDIYDSLKQVLT